MEADFLLWISSSAWISWYNSVNFLQHFTTFYNKLNPEHYDARLHAEEGEERVNLPPERHVDHLHAEGTDNVQINPERKKKKKEG